MHCIPSLLKSYDFQLFIENSLSLTHSWEKLTTDLRSNGFLNRPFQSIDWSIADLFMNQTKWADSLTGCSDKQITREENNMKLKWLFTENLT